MRDSHSMYATQEAAERKPEKNQIHTAMVSHLFILSPAVQTFDFHIFHYHLFNAVGIL